MKTIKYAVFAAVLIAISCNNLLAQTDEKPRNLILMIGDGMGFAQVKSYRYFANDPATSEIELLPFDAYLVGAVATETIAAPPGEDTCPDSCDPDPYAVVESASSASAYATGMNTQHSHLGMAADGQIQQNISEKARQAGKSIGIVATSEITHATPAAFAAHINNRRESASIADLHFDLQWEDKPIVSVFLGGGESHLKREDRDLTAEFAASGYTLVSNRDELLQAEGPRVLGLFAKEGMPRNWDRDTTDPSLADMTGKALNILSKNPQGFLLVVEGSQIDWAAHDNDVVGVISEMQDFSNAIDRALAFSQKHGDTLVIILADHETGGMSLGIDNVYAWNPRPLRGMNQTPEAMVKQFLTGDELLSDIVTASVSFELTNEEKTYLDSFERVSAINPETGYEEPPAYKAIHQVFDQRTLTGWSTMGHTGVDVPIYATGPGSEQFHGVMRNEEVGQKLQEVFLP